MMAPPMPAAVIVLRRALSPAQCRVLALVADAQTYAQIGAALHITERTVKMHVADIGDLLPATFMPNGSTKERVLLYAVRVLDDGAS
jgi:DNA-binding CsgD family transcriptional regulator